MFIIDLLTKLFSTKKSSAGSSSVSDYSYNPPSFDSSPTPAPAPVRRTPVKKTPREEAIEAIKRYNSIAHDRDDNLNYDTYTGRALYKATGRKRKVSIEVFPGDDIKSLLSEQGYDVESAEVNRSSADRPTENQIATFIDHGDPIPQNVSKYDISALLDRIIEGDTPPIPQMIDFATAHRVPISLFVGNKTLHSTIWNHLDEKGKFGFLLICIKHREDHVFLGGNFEVYCDKYDRAMLDKTFRSGFEYYLSRGFHGFSEGRKPNSYAYNIGKTFI